MTGHAATSANCSSGGDTLTFDNENRLRVAINATSATSYVYDGDGVRVSKTVTVSGVTTTAFYVGNYFEVAVSGGVTTTTKYFYFGAQRIAMRTSAGVTYLHVDHLGSTNASSGATQGSGAVYFPFGSPRAGNPPTDYTYTGQKVDASDGLMYYGARYYDAALGRFISADTIVPSASNPQALNRYSYTLNNPLRYTDPTGHCMDDGDGGCVRDTTTGRVILRESDWELAVRTTEGIDPPNYPPLKNEPMIVQVRNVIAISKPMFAKFRNYCDAIGAVCGNVKSDWPYHIDPFTGVPPDWLEQYEEDAAVAYDGQNIDLTSVVQQGLDNPLNMEGMKSVVVLMTQGSKNPVDTFFLTQLGLKTEIQNYEPTFLTMTIEHHQDTYYEAINWCGPWCFSAR